MKFAFALPVAFAALAIGATSSFAGDKDAPKKGEGKEAPPVRVQAKPRVLVFGEGAARFDVERDPTAGRMTFRLASPTSKIEGAPIVVMKTASGPREVTLSPVDGQPGSWYWADDAVKTERFDGTMRVVVAGKTYTSELAPVWTTESRAAWKARYGGRILTLADCGSSVEVVQDLATGTLTIYSSEDVVVTEAPVITVTQSEGPETLTLTRVEGKDGVWMTKSTAFRSTRTSASIRLLVNGKPCVAPLVYGSSRGGQMVTVTDGPNFEYVRDPKTGVYTFYAVDETYDGKAYTVENPTVVVGGKTYKMTQVEGEPRAWRLVGLDAAGSDSRDAQLNFTLFGKTLSTRLGLSGLGLDVK